jgi:hypothetical protein
MMEQQFLQYRIRPTNVTLEAVHLGSCGTIDEQLSHDVLMAIPHQI